MRSRLFISLLSLLLFVAISLIHGAANGAEISGTVRDNSGNLLPGVCVYVYSGPCWGDYVGRGQSDANGVYRVVVPNDGNYYLQANPQCLFDSELTVLEEWWTSSGGTRICDEAEPVSVTSGETGNVDFALDQGAVITGTVRDNSENLLPGVCVHVYSGPCWGDYVGVGTSDADGVYRVVVPNDGNYYLLAHPQCLFDSELTVLEEWWTSSGGTRICDEAEPVSVTSGETSGIDFSLDPGAIISGTVRDTDGNPLSNVYVNIYLDQCLGSGRVNLFTGGSNENGEYRTIVPASGNYYAYADPHAFLIDDFNLNVVDEWWTADGGTRICEDASPISVAIATEYPGIDFFLDPAAIISGTVRDTDGNPLSETIVVAYEGTCAELNNGEIDDVFYDYSSENGEYSLPVPINGEYFVAAIINFEPYSLEWWNENGQTAICEEASPISVAVAEYPGIDFTFDISTYLPDRDNDGDVDGVDLSMMIADFNSGLVSDEDIETFTAEFGGTQ